MRVRKKKHTDERIEKVSDYLCSPDRISGKQVYIEIGCGKGDFITQAAAAAPETTFYAIEIEKHILVTALEKAAALGLDNVKFLLGDAKILLENKENICDGIFLNFSDPWPKARQAKRRLTAPGFLELYKKILKPGAEIVMKTDNRPLFEYSLETLAEAGFNICEVTFDLGAEEAEGNIMTEYEKRFVALGVPICRLRAKI